MVSFLTSEITGPGLGIFDADDVDPLDILALDQLAVNAWPATESTDVNGWQMRFADGVSRRANSVAPFPLDPDAPPLATLIDTVETFYQGHGLPPRFQISPAAAPDTLDAILMEKGYAIEAPVSIQIARAHTQPASTIAIDITMHAPDGWWDVYIDAFDRDARNIAMRAKDQTAFASWRDEHGEIAAIGLGVRGGKWLGIFGMWTRPDLRGRSIGKNIIQALATWAVEQDVIGLYLQVEESNPKARQLYERIGFRHIYSYHYRTCRKTA